MDINALKQQIEAATREAFAEMVRLHKDEGIYAFALYSDEGAMTVCPSTNTRAHLARQERGDDGGEDPYYKFAPAEWAYEMQGADAAFNDIAAQLGDHALTFGDEEDETERLLQFEAFRHGLYEACVGVLEKLRREGYFRKILGEDVFLTFEVSDYDMETEQVKSIITRLNDAPYRDEYLAWMQSWDA